MMPGFNKLNYDNGYWPKSIDSILDNETLKFFESHIWLVALPLRRDGYTPFTETHISAEGAKRLAEATEAIWSAVKAHDAAAWGRATTEAFEAQTAMFPSMISPEMTEAIQQYKDVALGWKITGAGGGGYWVLISEKPVPNAIQIHACRE